MQSAGIAPQAMGAGWRRRLAVAVVVLILIAVITALALAFRRDPHDIKTGTVGKPAPAFELDRLVVYQDTLEVARDYTARMGNTWPSVVDAESRTAIAYGVFGIPETFFIGPDGVIAGRHIGPIDEETLVNGIESIRRGG